MAELDISKEELKLYKFEKKDFNNKNINFIHQKGNSYIIYIINILLF